MFVTNVRTLREPDRRTGKELDSGPHSRLYAQSLDGIQLLKIGQVARKTGLSVDAIRFYEKTGLLPRPARTGGGYRVYHSREVADLEFIQKAQRLGFSLNEIRELISIQRHPEEMCTHVRDLIAQKLMIIRSKIEELQRLEGGLTDALKQCRRALRQPTKHGDDCPVLREIAAATPKRKPS